MRKFIEIFIGVTLISIAYYYFLLPLNLVTGGVMGISIIIKDIITPYIFLYIMYAILIITGGIILGKEFLINSIFGAALQPTIIAILTKFSPDSSYIIILISESNRLLIASVSSAFINGVGLALMFKNNASSGGMDVVQKIINVKFKLPIQLAIYLTDGIVILIGLFSFGIEKTFFAILSMYLSSLVIEFVITGGKEKKALYIITDNKELVKDLIYNNINRGVTEIKATGGYSNISKSMLICLLSNREYITIKEILSKADCETFMYVTSANEVLGTGFSRPKIRGTF